MSLIPTYYHLDMNRQGEFVVWSPYAPPAASLSGRRVVRDEAGWLTIEYDVQMTFGIEPQGVVSKYLVTARNASVLAKDDSIVIFIAHVPTPNTAYSVWQLNLSGHPT